MAESTFPNKHLEFFGNSYNPDDYVRAIKSEYKDKSEIDCSGSVLLPDFCKDVVIDTSKKGGVYVPSKVLRIYFGNIYKVMKPCFIYTQHYSGKWDPMHGIKVYISNKSDMSDPMLLIDTLNASDNTAHSNNLFLLGVQKTVYVGIVESNSNSHLEEGENSYTQFEYQTAFVPTYGENISDSVKKMGADTITPKWSPPIDSVVPANTTLNTIKSMFMSVYAKDQSKLPSMY